MALTQADLQALDSAIARGELEVEHADGTRVRYRSIFELKQAYAHVQAQLANPTAESRRTGAFRFNFTTQRGD